MRSRLVHPRRIHKNNLRRRMHALLRSPPPPPRRCGCAWSAAWPRQWPPSRPSARSAACFCRHSAGPDMATNPDFKGFLYSCLLLSRIRTDRCYHRAWSPKAKPNASSSARFRSPTRPDSGPLSSLGDRSLPVQSRPLALPARWRAPIFRDIALPQMERGEAWHWTLRLRNAPSRIIGFISLTREKETNRGFWLALPWHGQGLMTEACAWANDYWFETLASPSCASPKPPPTKPRAASHRSRECAS